MQLYNTGSEDFDYIPVRILILLGLILWLLSPFFYEKVVVGEKVCVDGHLNKNLEGIMCEDTKIYIFGISEEISYLLLVPVSLLGIFIFWI